MVVRISKRVYMVIKFQNSALNILNYLFLHTDPEDYVKLNVLVLLQVGYVPRFETPSSRRRFAVHKRREPRRPVQPVPVPDPGPDYR